MNRIHSRHRYTIAPRKAKWHTERQEDDIGTDLSSFGAFTADAEVRGFSRWKAFPISV